MVTKNIKTFIKEKTVKEGNACASDKIHMLMASTSSE
jgi:hypothetical protein